MIAWNDFLYHFINGLAGRWLAIDSFFSLVLENDLVKGAVIGACLLIAWYKGRSEDESRRYRTIVIATIAASFLVIATTKTASRLLPYPRPYVMSQKTYILRGETLAQAEPVKFVVPLDDASQERWSKLRHGNIELNDMETFPSDHAGFFFCVSLGLCLVSPWLGGIALFWTTAVIFAAKVYNGDHTPLDLLAGAAVAVFWLTLVVQFMRGPGRSLLDRMSAWTLANPSISTALIFLVTFEAANTFHNTHEILSVGKHLVHVWRVKYGIY